MKKVKIMNFDKEVINRYILDEDGKIKYLMFNEDNVICNGVRYSGDGNRFYKFTKMKFSEEIEIDAEEFDDAVFETCIRLEGA
jgi:hypothetical protein